MRYNTDTAALELSVAELCALAHQSGHLDARRPRRVRSIAKKSRNGIEKRENCACDVPLCNTTLYEGISYTVEGVADAVLTEEGRVTVEEVKEGYSPRDDAYSLPSL